MVVRRYEEGTEPNSLRQLRRERQVSQAEVARRVGLSRQSVSAIENGRVQPRLAVAYRLARFYGRSIENVFRLEVPSEVDGEQR